MLIKHPIFFYLFFYNVILLRYEVTSVYPYLSPQEITLSTLYVFLLFFFLNAQREALGK